MKIFLSAAVAAVFSAFLASPVAAQTPCSVTLPNASGLQAAIDNCANAAADGQIISINAGDFAVPTTLRLPDRPGALRDVTIQTAGGCEDRPILPADKPKLAVLRASFGSVRIFETATQARGWRFQCLGLGPAPGVSGAVLTWMGDPYEKDVTRRAVGISFDRVLFDTAGQPTHSGVRVGLVERFSFTRNYCGDFLEPGTDTQCVVLIGAYCQTCVITDNFFGAATEPLLFGGDDPSVPSLNPVGITIERNTFYLDRKYKGSRVGVFKHLLELKQGINVAIRHNRFVNTWPDEGHGTAPAVLISVRNQSGGCPGCEVSNVLVENNIFQGVSQGVQFIGRDDIHTSAKTHDVIVRNNVIEFANQCFMGVLSPNRVTLPNNTCARNGAVPNSWMMLANADAPVGDTIAITNSIIANGVYGLNALPDGIGTAALKKHYAAATMTGNIIGEVELSGGQTDPSYYPPGQTFLDTVAFKALFVDYVGGNYCLKVYAGKGADCALLAAVPALPTVPDPPVGGEGGETPVPVPPIVIPPPVVTPPAIDCQLFRDAVKVTRWPRGNGNGNKSGTWTDGGYEMRSEGFKWAPLRFEAVGLNGCTDVEIR